MGEHTAFLLLLVATLTRSSEVGANGEISALGESRSPDEAGVGSAAPVSSRGPLTAPRSTGHHVKCGSTASVFPATAPEHNTVSWCWMYPGPTRPFKQNIKFPHGS